jgi:Flp pilus assembly protein CpaB
MRLRTFILLVLVLLVGAAIVAVVALGVLGGTGPLAGLAGSGTGVTVTEREGAPDGAPEGENGPDSPLPQPDPTPSIQFAPVVVARVPIPVGQRLQPELLEIEMRPNSNIAIAAGYTYDTIGDLVGRIVKVDVAANQEILSSMLALNPTDLSAFGSDLSLYIDRGRVSVAFPIDRYTGAAYGVRPGDFVDVLMTLDLVEVDPEFQSRLPNRFQRVDRTMLEEAQPFLLSPELAGRLELVQIINAVGLVAPTTNYEVIQQPRRATQLTLQQVEVIWVGNWLDASRGFAQAYDSAPALSTAPVVAENGAPEPKERPEDEPDMLILSLTLQDAMFLKFAQETGIRLTLALRAQGDNSNFVTTSIHMFQLVEQGLLAIPEPGSASLEPRLERIEPAVSDDNEFGP